MSTLSDQVPGRLDAAVRPERAHCQLSGSRHLWQRSFTAHKNTMLPPMYGKLEDNVTPQCGHLMRTAIQIAVTIPPTANIAGARELPTAGTCDEAMAPAIDPHITRKATSERCFGPCDLGISIVQV
jgi:hypothetical protein